MKTLLSLVCLLLFIGVAKAGDVSCDVNALKPKLNASVIKEEAEKPAKITVAEARIRLSKNKHQQAKETAQIDKNNQVEKDKDAEEKESGLGSMFDILLPSKLRNPVEK